MTINRETGNGILAGWLRWVEPWYLVFTLLGIVISGVIPVLLPLRVSQSGSPAQIGWVMAAVSLGGLSAPLWGVLTDRYRLHRWVLVSGLFLTAAGLILFTLSSQSVIWFGLALLLSAGAAGTSTVGNLFIVEMHPKTEWDERISWLQTFYGMGQVIGLVLAGLLSRINLDTGLLITGALAVAAVLLGWLTTRTPENPPVKKPVLLRAARHAELSIHSPQRFFHHLSRKGIKQFGTVLRSRFGLFMAVWVLTFAGSATVFSQYPLLMKKVFSITPDISSVAFAVMAGLSLMLYTPSGIWSERFGSVPVLRVSLLMRLAAFIGVFVLGFTLFNFKGWLALVAFAFVVLAWPLMNVSVAESLFV